MNVLEEVTRRYVERENSVYGDGYMTVSMAAPWIGSIVADVMDLLSADGRLHPTAAHPDTQHGQEVGEGE